MICPHPGVDLSGVTQKAGNSLGYHRPRNTIRRTKFRGNRLSSLGQNRPLAAAVDARAGKPAFMPLRLAPTRAIRNAAPADYVCA